MVLNLFNTMKQLEEDLYKDFAAPIFDVRAFLCLYISDDLFLIKNKTVKAVKPAPREEDFYFFVRFTINGLSLKLLIGESGVSLEIWLAFGGINRKLKPHWINRGLPSSYDYGKSF